MKKSSNKHRPFALFLLAGGMFWLGASAMAGGGSLLFDPSGQTMQMDARLLTGSPFSDFLVPGLVLFFVLGVFPLVLSVLMLLRREWPLAEYLNLFPDKHWTWAYSLYASIALVIWMDVQLMMVGYSHPVQAIYAFLGVALLVLTLLPVVQRHFER